MKTAVLLLVLAAAIVGAAPAAASEDDALVLPLRVRVPAAIAAGTPVAAAVELPASWPQDAWIRARLRAPGVPDSEGQIVRLPGGKAELWWILPAIGGLAELTFKAHLAAGAAPVPREERFLWCDVPGAACRDLLLGERLMLRYMHAFDPSSPERLEETYKPYHHVFDAAGREPITKGPGGLYSHHRGIFIGWNKLGHRGRIDDFWHMKGVTQQHVEFLAEAAGPVLARSTALIHWIAAKDAAAGESAADHDRASAGADEGITVIAEERTITMYRQPDAGDVLIDFTSRLTAQDAGVHLDGDPEHAGFQFRAHNGVAEGHAAAKAVYVFHRDGVDPLADFDLPWVAMAFGPKDARYTVQYISHRENPSPSIYSAYRDYGRFGACFATDIPAGETLALRYRLAVTAHDPPARSEMERRAQAFYDPPAAAVRNE